MYDDEFMLDWITKRGETLDDYNKYIVVPRRLAIANKALKRYDQNPDPYSPDVRNLYLRAGHWMDLEFGKFISGSVLSSLDEVLTWLEHDTSPGYPWTLKYHDKLDYWSGEGADFFRQYWESLKTPDPIISMCSVTIKEELRLKTKVDDDRARSIIAFDVNNVTANCVVTLDQNKALINTCEYHCIKMGLNLLKGGAHKLVTEMECWPRSSLSLDGIQFDGHFTRLNFENNRDFRYRMLRQEFQTDDVKTILFNIFENKIVKLLVNINGTVYKCVTGNPSGQADTTVDNSLKTYQDSAVLWMLSVPEEMRNYTSYREHVKQIICGDDWALSVHPDAQKYFNKQSIFSNAKLIGMEYTSETEDFVDFRELTFLGHGFIEHDVPGQDFSMFLPKIDCDKMRCSMVHYNEAHTLEMTVIRANGLRAETFACIDCRKWFAELIDDLRVRCGTLRDVELVNAWKTYKTDQQLWELYTGYELYTDFQRLPVSAPAEINTPPQRKLQSMKSLREKITDAVKVATEPGWRRRTFNVALSAAQAAGRVSRFANYVPENDIQLSAVHPVERRYSAGETRQYQQEAQNRGRPTESSAIAVPGRGPSRVSGLADTIERATRSGISPNVNSEKMAARKSSSHSGINKKTSGDVQAFLENSKRYRADLSIEKELRQFKNRELISPNSERVIRNYINERHGTNPNSAKAFVQKKGQVVHRDFLVGVEPNPGPKSKQNKKSKVKKTPKAAQILRRAAVKKLKHATVTRFKQGTNDKFRRVTDGLNSGSVMTNLSGIADRFTRRTEKCFNLYGNTATTFSSTGYVINPGNSVLFPIFSRTAVAYEQYRIKYLRFDYWPEQNLASGSVTFPGKVLIMVDSNTTDKPKSDTDIEDQYNSVKGVPYARFGLNALRGDANGKFDSIKNWFVYPSANSDADEPSIKDAAKLWISVLGTPDTKEIGELYVTYEFEMIKPRRPTTGSSTNMTHVYSTAGTATAASPIGNGALSSGSTFTLATTATTFQFPINSDGRYSVTLSWYGANIGANPTVSLNSINALVGSQYNNGSLSSVAIYGATTASTMFILDILSGPTACIVTISGLTSMTGANWDIYAVQIPAAFTISQNDKLIQQLLPSIRKMLRDEQKENDSEDYAGLTPRLSLASAGA